MYSQSGVCADALGGVILLQPDPLPQEAGVGGTVDVVATNNYRLGAMAAMAQGALDKKLGGLAWRLQGTLKAAGNTQTPHYYLKNTGFTEDNYSAAVGYQKNGWSAQSFYSQFNTRIGVFAGSHVGNVGELYAAFARTRPKDSSQFSYAINRSNQWIAHTLFKNTLTYQSPTFGRAELQYAYQANRRQEYDLDLPFVSDPTLLYKPQVDFKIVTDIANITYHTPQRARIGRLLGAQILPRKPIFLAVCAT